MHRLERSLLVWATALLVHPTAGGQDPGRRSGVRPASSGGVFEIVSCSLGCQRGPSGFTCSEVEIHVNEEIRITFNGPVAQELVPVWFESDERGQPAFRPG